LYALVSTPYDVALHFNKKLFEDNAAVLRPTGVDVDHPPTTLAQLDACATLLTQTDGDGRVLRAGYLPLEPGWYQEYACFWFGGSWWDEQARRFTFTDPAVVKSYDWIQSYSRSLGRSGMTEFRAGLGGFDSPQNPFLIGSVAMVQQGTFMANFIHNLNPDMDGNWSAAAFPSADPKLQDVTYCTADILVIPHGAPHRNEAFEFIAYLNRQDVMERLCAAHCKISPLAEVSESFLTNHPNPYISLFERLARSPNAHGTPPVPIMPEVSAELNDFVQRLAMLETTPDEGLKTVQLRLQAKYDEFIRRQGLRNSQ